MSHGKTKVCTGCGKRLPLSKFYPRRERPNGRRPRCKNCMESWKKLYRAKHTEEIAAYNKAWRAQHPGYDKQWRGANHERACMLERARYHKRKKLGTLLKKDWVGIKKRQKERDPEKWAARNREAARRRRDMKYAVGEAFTRDMEIHALDFQLHKCQVCSSTTRLNLDHWLPLYLGHALTVGNAVVLCKSCNSHKSRHLPNEVYRPGFVARIERMLRAQLASWELEQEMLLLRTG